MMKSSQSTADLTNSFQGSKWLVRFKDSELASSFFVFQLFIQGWTSTLVMSNFKKSVLNIQLVVCRKVQRLMLSPKKHPKGKLSTEMPN